MVVRGLGSRILPIIASIKDTSGFFVVLATVYMAFTHSYVILGTARYGGKGAGAVGYSTAGSNADTFYAHVLHGFRLGFLGDFSMSEIEGVGDDAAKMYVANSTSGLSLRHMSMHTPMHM